jgi:hypothetical protein
LKLGANNIKILYYEEDVIDEALGRKPLNSSDKTVLEEKKQ